MTNNMERTRVKKGEKYWYLDLVYLDVIETQEMNSGLDNFHYRKNNYFATKEDAEAMARKLRAVLKGADVIEMPSEEEFYEFAPSTNKLGGSSLENIRQVRGFQDCWDWIKSKIVK